MARKSFALNTDPHIAEVGDTELAFQPEVMGDEFLDTYGRLKESYDELGISGTGDLAGLDVEKLRQSNDAVRAFLSELMLPESAAKFAGMPLPARVLVDLLEWTMEVYGGGRPPTQSNASSTPSKRGGTTGTGASRSKGSARTRGR